MNPATAIDLSKLPVPAVLESLDYETIFQEMKEQFNGLQPLLLNDSGQPHVLPATLITLDNGEKVWQTPALDESELQYLALESDAIVRQLQISAYRELLIRQRVNDGARAVLVARTSGSDLDNLVALLGVKRLTIQEADLQATPPVVEIKESDEALRRRYLLAPDQFTTAGSEDSYLFHSLSADGRVKDANPVSPAATENIIYVLSHEGNGTASQELIDVVDEHLSIKKIRPNSELVTVASAEIIEYELVLDMTLYSGASQDLVIAEAQKQLEAYTVKNHKLAHDITDSGVKNAGHIQDATHELIVTSPVLPIRCDAHQAAYCTGITINNGGVDV